MGPSSAVLELGASSWPVSERRKAEMARRRNTSKTKEKHCVCCLLGCCRHGAIEGGVGAILGHPGLLRLSSEPLGAILEAFRVVRAARRRHHENPEVAGRGQEFEAPPRRGGENSPYLIWLSCDCNKLFEPSGFTYASSYKLCIHVRAGMHA